MDEVDVSLARYGIRREPSTCKSLLSQCPLGCPPADSRAQQTDAMHGRAVLATALLYQLKSSTASNGARHTPMSGLLADSMHCCRALADAASMLS